MVVELAGLMNQDTEPEGFGRCRDCGEITSLIDNYRRWLCWECDPCCLQCGPYFTDECENTRCCQCGKLTEEDEMKTCGPLYFEALEKYTAGDENLIRAFAAGFISGEGEKVYLGACEAAMFRPSEKYCAMVLAIVEDVAHRYDLNWTTIGVGEIWMCRLSSTGKVKALTNWRRNSPTWHRLRAQLCGVPKSEIDEKFHERKGYGEPCDLVQKG